MTRDKLQINTARAGEALESETARYVWERVKNGDELTSIAGDELADWAIEKYRPHVIHAMQRAGLEVPDNITQLSAADVVQIIGDGLELQLDSLDPDSIADAMDARLSREVGRKLGIEITTLRNAESIKQACIDAVMEAVRSGKANQLISKWMVRRFKTAKAWAEAGIAAGDERRLVRNRISQRAWRKRYKWVWNK